MTIPEKMMGVFKTEPGYDKMDFLPLDVPKAVDDKVLIKVAFTGICGSDIHTFKGEYNNPTTPVVLGHEFSGQVVAVGDQVTKVKVGDRVTSETTFETSTDISPMTSSTIWLCGARGLGPSKMVPWPSTSWPVKKASISCQIPSAMREQP